MNPLYGDPRQIYREQQVSALGTGRLVLLALTAAERACRTGQRGLLTRVLQELVAGLDLDSGEVASGLLVLYEYMLHEVREGRIAEVEGMISELRGAWEEGLRGVDADGARRGAGTAAHAA